MRNKGTLNFWFKIILSHKSWPLLLNKCRGRLKTYCGRNSSTRSSTASIYSWQLNNGGSHISCTKSNNLSDVESHSLVFKYWHFGSGRSGRPPTQCVSIFTNWETQSINIWRSGNEIQQLTILRSTPFNVAALTIWEPNSYLCSGWQRASSTMGSTVG